jgi:NTP pyrophosphatase (non-canonical NTP hydrolase)
MELNEYQKAAGLTAIYPSGLWVGLVYTTLGLNGEAGEIAEKVKKLLRDDKTMTEERRQELILELGDVLWYLANLAKELDVSLEEIATQNIAKLASRNKRNVIKGDGDNR